MNKTKFMPAVLFPLPVEQGLTVVLMTITALVAVSLVIYFIRAPKRELF